METTNIILLILGIIVTIFVIGAVLNPNLARWNASFNDNSLVSLITYKPLNHLFITGEDKPTNTEYMVPGNVEEQVIIDIANWITVLSGGT